MSADPFGKDRVPTRRSIDSKSQCRWRRLNNFGEQPTLLIYVVEIRMD
jgi:hypothetical protein